MAPTTPPSPTEPHPSESDGEKKEQDLSINPSDDHKLESNHVLGPEILDSSVSQEDEWISGMRLFTIMAAVTIVCFLMLLDISIIVTAIPRVTSQFHSLPDVGWYGSAYQLASAALQPLTGKFYMNFNTQWTFMVFFAIFELGSLICGVANSSKMLIVGRAIAGIGSSGILNGAFTIIAACVPLVKRPALIGSMMGVSQLGLVIGPLVGGVLTQYTTWRWCFYINLPIGGIVAAMIAFIRVPGQISKPKPMSVIRTLPSKLDLIGFVLFAPAAIQLLLALQYGGTRFAWNSAQIIGLFCGAGATFIIFMAWEYYRGDEAMIPFSVVRERVVWASCLVYGFMMAQLFCASYYLPIFFQGVKGVSPTLSGVYVLPGVLGQLFTAVASGFMVGRLGYYLPFSVVGGLMIAIANGLLSTLSPSISTAKWIGYQILLGAGRGLGLQMPIIAVQNTLPPTKLPVAMAILMFSQSFFGATFLSFADTIFTNSLKTIIPKYAPSIDPQSVINAGATGFRSNLKGTELANVLVAYAKSIDRVFYLSVGAAMGCFTLSWAIGWADIRKKRQVSKA